MNRESSTPKKPETKAKDIAPVEVPAILIIRGKALPTKPTVRPVSMPVINGSKKRIGNTGMPSCKKNWLRFYRPGMFP